jgi:DNA-binding MltR family transcriptional regulator
MSKKERGGEIKNAKSYWNNILELEFKNETDRGAVILAASLFDLSLTNLLKSFLVSNPSSKDDIFEGPNSPMGSFSSKISMSYRLGLISSKFSRDLNLIRKIRNEFAHNIQGCNFEHSGVMSRVQELINSCSIIKYDSKTKETFPDGHRGDFLLICSWMLWSIHSKIEEIQPLENCEDEMGYLEEEFYKKAREKKDSTE